MPEAGSAGERAEIRSLSVTQSSDTVDLGPWTITQYSMVLAGLSLVAEVSQRESSWEWWVYRDSLSGELLAKGTGPTKRSCMASAINAMEEKLILWFEGLKRPLI